ncbi:MAG: hypothetical protein AAF358_23410 [Pseudomonadota bacterium]
MRKLTLLALLCVAAPQAIAQFQFELLPNRVAVGGDLSGSVRGDGAQVERVVRLAGVSDSLQLITSFSTDPAGRGAFVGPLPDSIAPGSYTVELYDDAENELLTTAALEVIEPPVIDFAQRSGFGGTEISVTFSNLVPGLIEFYLDDIPLIGSRAVSEAEYTTTVVIPKGREETLVATLINRVGTRVVGVGSDSLLRREQTLAAPSVRSLTWPSSFSRNDIIDVEGTLSVPEGTRVTDYSWSVVWIADEGGQYPVNTQPLTFDLGGQEAPLGGEPVGFRVDVALPSIQNGFPPADRSDKDQLGFVYTNPKTGQSGRIVHPSAAVGLQDEFGITITGKLVAFESENDPDLSDNEPIVGAIWNVAAKTALIEPGTQFVNPLAGKGEQEATSVNVLATELHGNNQLVNPNIQLLTPTGCPKTLNNGVTNSQGEFSFAFSPQQTDYLNFTNTKIRATAGGEVEYIPPKIPFDNEFLIRLNGLLLGFGIPIGTEEGSNLYGGLRYDFRREFDGTYFFRSNLDSDFEVPFDPTQTLISVMPTVELGAEQELQSTPFIEGLAKPDDAAVVRFSKVIAFPQLRGTDLDDRTATLVLPWSTALFGELEEDVLVKLGNQVVGVMTPDSGVECALEDAYRIAVSGLATWNLNGAQSAIVPGRIETATNTGALYYKDFEVVIEQGPTWWDDPNRFENVNVFWNLDRIVISADEKADKVNDATAPNVPKDVGTVENDNMEMASMRQVINGGVVETIQRTGFSDQVVANQPTGPGKLVETFLTGSAASFASRDLTPAEHQAFRKTLVDDDCNPGEGVVQCLKRRFNQGIGFETTGSSGPRTILDTGKIPLFRYAWGVPPIAALTIGADVWFRATLTYFAFLDQADLIIDVDGLVEPEVNGGLDLFVDLSALGGIVSASATASPALGISMPIVVTNTLLNELATRPCFNFVMDIVLEVALGPCPLCAELRFSERMIDYAEPNMCVVSGLNKSRKNIQRPIAGKLAIATDGFGTTASVYATDTGIKSFGLAAGTPGDLQDLDSGPGAMRPAAAFFDVGKGIAVWAQSSLDQAAFDALPDQVSDDPCHDDPSSSYADTLTGALSCDEPGPNRLPGTEFQHMVYAVLENGTWGPTLDLTLPSTGEGGVELAACMGGDPGCAPGGEILAVWEIDTAGDINEQSIKLRYARFDGATQSWSPVTTVDPGSTAKDVQAEPLYIAGDLLQGISAQPVITWIRNPLATRQNLNLQSRELWYEFIEETAGPQKATTLPAGVSSPSADDFSDGTFAVAFTQSSDTTFFGNRRSLWLARARNCSAGTCTWFGQALLDDGLQIYVENPTIQIDSFDRVSIVGRQVGIEGNPASNQSIGVVTGTGDLFQYRTTLADLSVGENSQLSNDGAVNWQPEATFDPISNNLIVVNAKGLSVEQLSQARLGKSIASDVVTGPVPGVMSKGLDSTVGVFINVQQRGPDGALTGAVPASRILSAGETVDVEVTFDNLGEAFNSEVTLAAYWDGPLGVGSSAGERLIRPDYGPAVQVLSVPIPRTFQRDEVHTLYVTLNPEMSPAETTLDNNTLTVEFGAMPVPFDPRPSTDQVGTIAFLDWSIEEDDRVVGYRIYRREEGSTTIYSVGFSPVNGFADANVRPNTVYQYRIASLSENMMESAPSDWVTLGVSAVQTDRVFRDSFEGTAGTQSAGRAKRALSQVSVH